MLRSSPIADILELLTELEARVHAHPQLEAEWIGELEKDPAAATQPQARARFVEWFLLERDSLHLGSPPVQAWAPKEAVPDSAWDRLLDNFLGIFRIAGTRRSEGREFFDVLDLWSGRMAHLPADILAGGSAEESDLLFVGRLVLADGEAHLPLPGLRLAQAPGLVQAVESDLALARHQNPRARISQRECDALFRAIPEETDAEQIDAESVDALLAELESILQAAPDWSWARIQDSLNREGLTGTLDRLAFETIADLEALRRVLPALANHASKAAEAASIAQPETDESVSDQTEASRALDVYDLARAEGLSLDEAFQKLEEALGLEPGTSEELLPDQARDRAPVGPEETAGLDPWIEAYLWEQHDETAAQVPSPETEAVLRAFALHAQVAAGKMLDAQDIQATHVLPFLMAAEDEAGFLQRRAGMLGFLQWAAQEQDAPLEAALDDWATDEDQRLPAMMRANQAMQTTGVAWRNRQVLTETDPPRVTAEAGESVQVRGLPSEVEACLRPGDLVLGSWIDGQFHAAALVPGEAIPEQRKESDSAASAEAEQDS